jgi:hypothetical protein
MTCLKVSLDQISPRKYETYWDPSSLMVLSLPFEQYEIQALLRLLVGIPDIFSIIFFVASFACTDNRLLQGAFKASVTSLQSMFSIVFGPELLPIV